MRPVLVTGAAGFIGSRVAAQLLERGETVVGLDSLNDYYDPAIKEGRLQDLLPHPRFRFQRMDIEDYPALSELFDHHRFRTVFHLAARAGVRYSLENPWAYMRTNVDGTLNVLEAMRRSGTPKLVLASTSSLYAGLPAPLGPSRATASPGAMERSTPATAARVP